MKFTEKAQRRIYNVIGKAVNKLAQNEGGALENTDKTVTDGMPELLRAAGAEGTVLLRNDGNILPFKPENCISVFGRVQLDWFYVGYGSGGDVNKPYTVSLIDGLIGAGVKLNTELLETYKAWCEKNPPDHGFWGHWPRYYPEMPIDDSTIRHAAKNSDTALVVIGRAAGEDRENRLEKGSYLLTDEEDALIKNVTSSFNETVIILNIGSPIDMSWEKKLTKSNIAILIPWQGGMESGNALADVLTGKVEPSGRLTDTIAKRYEDYPCSADFGNKDFNYYTEDIFVGYRYFETFNKGGVLYPFGFGLGYTEFKRTLASAKLDDNTITLNIKSENIGTVHSGKDVAEVYVSAPMGVLGKPKKALAAFKKTKLLAPGESEDYTLTFELSAIASYDEAGATGNKSCYVLESGEYKVHLGGDVRNAEKVWSFNIDETLVTEKLAEVSAPEKAFKVLKAKTNENGEIVPTRENCHARTEDLRKLILANLPESTPYTGDKGYKLDDVKNGKCTLREFIAQLSTDELEAISRGDYTMDSPLGAKGNAGAMGGVLESLRAKGIPAVITTDGPSGIRLKSYCSLLPIGTALACMWNIDLAEALYNKLGGEMKNKGSDILLAPGMNIHRSVLCGRNFEYYSEDPLVAGKTASAVVKGLQSAGVSACPKHFACNSQETNRNHNDSRVSERALREIYLKGFEICVKESAPLNIMTSYNKINGVWGHYNYDLCTRILRGEWGFKGNVMTDWWMQYTTSPEFPAIKDNGYRVRAGVDVLMPGGNRAGKRKPDGTLLKTLGKEDGITLGELQKTAEHVLNMIMELK